MPDQPWQELVIALAGPAVNMVIVIVLSVTICLLHGWRAIFVMPTTEGPLLNFSLMVNLIMTLFNMLPAFPMDGGRVLRAILASRVGYVRATDIAATVGQGFAILLGILGVFTSGMLIFIALFVYLGAQQEAIFAQTHSVLNGVSVQEAMRTHFSTLQRHDALHLQHRNTSPAINTISRSLTRTSSYAEWFTATIWYAP